MDDIIKKFKNKEVLKDISLRMEKKATGKSTWVISASIRRPATYMSMTERSR
jgi:hypothetical protein